MDEARESSRVELIKPKDTLAQVGQVSRLEDEHLQWVKGLEKIKEKPYWKAVLETIPLSEVNSVEYRSIIAVVGMMAGVVMLSAGVGAIVLMVAEGFISIWLIGVALVLMLAGPVFIFGGRRRRLTFSCKDREITWTSGALEFRDSALTMIRVREWAEKRQIPAINFPDPMELLRKGR